LEIRMISVDIRAPEFDIAGHWDALAQRAPANVFMHPAALRAAAASGFARIHMLLAWDKSGADKLVGFWALRERRVAPFCSFLTAPAYDYCFVSSPVIDPDHIDTVMPAFLDAIENDKSLPNVIQLKSLDGDSESHQAMLRALSARAGQTLMLSERARPFLSGEADRKRSGSTGKKLRQDWNRLSALGAVDIANERAPLDARDAFEVFLKMEDQSWKGANGTSLLADDGDAAFARRLIADLAAGGNASVALLRVDGKAIAAQVLLYSGTMAYTWKIAFDAEFAKYSPGALLIDKVTDELFAGGIAQIESCSADGSFMANLWTGKRMTVDMLADVGARKSASFALAAAGERGFAWLRETRNRLRAMPWPALPKRKNLAVTRG
jgi:CelD/BcsL family acetyltransferase involved in cellulose biosynthesis